MDDWTVERALYGGSTINELIYVITKPRAYKNALREARYEVGSMYNILADLGLGRIEQLRTLSGLKTSQKLHCDNDWA